MSTATSIMITAFASIAAPLFLFVQWLLKRKHTEEIEDTASITEAVGAITAANVNIAAVVKSLLEPMQEEVKRLAAVEAAQSIALRNQQEELTDLQRRFTSIVRYVNILRRQVMEAGHEPYPVPDDLDLSGFNFD